MSLRLQDARQWTGVSDGATISVANSDQPGCHQLDTVSITGTGSAITFDTGEPGFLVEGSTDGTTYCEWTDLAAADEFAAVLAATGWAAPSGTPRVIDIRTAANGHVARCEVDTNGRVGLYGGSTQYDYSAVGEAVTAGTGGWRLELTGKISTQKLRAALYVASDGEGSTAIWDSGEISAVAYGSAASWARFGIANTANTADFTMRYFAADTTYGLLGPILPAPTGLTWDGAALHWTAVVGATSYTIEKDGTEVAAGVTATSWTDTGAAAGVGHRYRVRAVA